MAPPITSPTTTSTYSSLSSSPPVIAPIGIGSSPTSLSSANPSTGSGFCGTIQGYVHSCAAFLKQLVVSTWQKMRSGCRAVGGCFGIKSSAAPQATSTWQIPVEARPALSPAAQDPFSVLSLSDVDRQKIFTLIHTMGGSWWTLVSKRAEMERLGEEIKNVHPLKFLEYIFRHPVLPQDMESIGKSSLTWNPFINGLTEKLRKEAATLPPSIPGFAHALNVNLADIQPYLSTLNGEGLVKFLIDVKLGRRSSVWSSPAPTPVATIPLPIPTITPPPLPRVAAPIRRLVELPFESADKDILTALMENYSKNTRAWLIWNWRPLALQWHHLGARHPLTLLLCLFATPALTHHLLIIFQYWGTKALFMRAFTYQLSQLPLVEVRPYLDEFAQACQLNPDRTKTLVQNGNWSQIIEDLLQKHLERQLSP